MHEIKIITIIIYYLSKISVFILFMKKIKISKNTLLYLDFIRNLHNILVKIFMIKVTNL